MTPSTRFRLGSCLLLMLGSADALGCMTLEQFGRSVAIKNECGRPMNVAICVDNPKSYWACPNHGGLLGLNNQSDYPIPDYYNSGGGEIHWAACPKPATPYHWDGRAKTTECR